MVEDCEDLEDLDDGGFSSELELPPFEEAVLLPYSWSSRLERNVTNWLQR